MTDTPEDRTDEAHFSAEQSRPRAPAWISASDGDAGRPHNHPRASRPGPQEAFGLTTLKRRADFLRANGGRRHATPGFVLQLRPRADGDLTKRVGFTVTKKIGNAVLRNRCKRRLRGLARDILPRAGSAGADHVLIGRSECPTRDYATMRAELEGACRRLAK